VEGLGAILAILAVLLGENLAALGEVVEGAGPVVATRS